MVNKNQKKNIAISGIVVIIIAFFIFFLFGEKLAITSSNLDYIKSKCSFPFLNVYQCGSYYCVDSDSGRCQDVDSNCKNAPVVYNCLYLGIPENEAVCMPDSNNLCLEPININNIYYCDIDKTQNCGSLGCSNGKCNIGETTCESPYVKYNGKCEIIACGILGNNCPSDSNCINDGTPSAYCKNQDSCKKIEGQLCNPTKLSLSSYKDECEKLDLIRDGFTENVEECEKDIVLCVQIAGTLCNSITKELKAYNDGCERTELTTQGFIDDLSFCKVVGCPLASESLNCTVNEELKIKTNSEGCQYTECVPETIKCNKFQTLKEGSCTFSFEKFFKDTTVLVSLITGFIFIVVIIFIIAMPKRRRR